MQNYSLKTILSTFSKSNGKRRTIFNAGPIGGVNDKLIILFFILLPLIDYAIFFNPYVFDKLGIAASIVAFIVSLSIVMIIIFLTTLKAKKNVIKKITPSWKKYFKDIDLNMVLSTGITPYSKFFEFYETGLKKNLSEEELHKYLINAFTIMEEENKDLIESLKRDNQMN